MKFTFNRDKIIKAFLMSRLSQSELTARAQVHAETVGRALKGEPIIATSFQKICDALGVKAVDVMEGEKEVVFKQKRDIFFKMGKLLGGGYAVVSHSELSDESACVMVTADNTALEVLRFADAIFDDDEDFYDVDIVNQGSGYLVIARFPSGRAQVVFTRIEDEAEDIRIFINQAREIEKTLQPLTVATEVADIEKGEVQEIAP